MRKTLKKLAKKIFERFGYNIQKINASKPIGIQTNVFTMKNALQRCEERGVYIESVVDVGASDGRWSGTCMEVFPEANYLLVEAQEGHKEGLENFTVKHMNAQYVLAAAGPKDGNIYFDNGDLFGGVASETPFPENCIEVPVIALDSEISRKNLKGPYLLKLDTHGFEVPILEGALKIIENASLIIIETYNFKLNSNSLRYWEICNYMDTLGFAPVENVDLMLRDLDKAFWQMDTFYVPKSDKVFLHNSYQ